MFIARRMALLLVLASVVSGCMGLEPESHGTNPLGWPAKALSIGHHAADSEIPLYREVGRTALAFGDLLESPPLLLEGVVTFDGDKILGSSHKLLVGTGGSIAALINVPFSFVIGGNIDLGRDVDLVNDALEHMDEADPATWRVSSSDERTGIYPRGTRVEASGKNLIWKIPGVGDVVQSAEISPALSIGLGITGMAHVAQARTWGFVVGSRHKWRLCSPRLRTTIIIHEFYHQHMQIRSDFQGWAMLYWPAYGAGTITAGDDDHWAETGSPAGAYVVNRALREWRPELRPSSNAYVEVDRD